MPHMSQRPQPPHVLENREVLNRHWPARPRAFTDHRPGVPVTARVVFAGDGETWLHGHAIRWDETHIYVEADDRRLRANGVWLKPDDVYRAEPDSTGDE